jgi:uncharacterized protein
MTTVERTAPAAMGEPYVGPVQGRERFSSVDVVRGVALFGILLMNIVGFGYGLWFTEFQQEGAGTGANFWAWYIPDTFFEGTQRGLFSLLFGAGVIILTSRAEKAGAGVHVADIYYRRNLWLIAFGMADSYLLLWDGDILYHYGLIALFLFPLRNMKPAHLVSVGVVAMLVLAGQNLYEANARLDLEAEYASAQAVLDDGGELDEEQQEAFDGWNKKLKEFNYNAEEHAEDVEVHRKGYWSVFMHHLPSLVDIHGNVTYRYIFLDGLSMMLIGMALFKLGVLTLQRPARFYWLMLVIGYGIGVPVNMWESQQIIDGGYTLMAYAPTTLTYDVGRVGVTFGHLALLLLFVRSGWLTWLRDRLAAVGRMALTNYLMHSVICAVIFLGVGFGLYGQLERYQIYYVVLGICVFQLIVSKIWLARYRFGPMEWLWRSLTYKQTQPMSRS